MTAEQDRPTLVEELDALVGGRWPGHLRELFSPEDPKPLAIGIGREIADALGLDQHQRRDLGHLLGRWTGRISYLKRLRDRGAMRYGIDGQPVAPVSREHEIAARQQIHRTRLKRERRRAEQEHQRAEAAAAQAENAELARLRRANAARPTLRLGGAP